MSEGFKNISASTLMGNPKRLALFLQLYAEVSGKVELSATCASCIQDYLNDYRMRTYEKINAGGFEFNPRYNGVAATPGSNDFIGSGNLTLELALTAYEHRGRKMFTKVPSEEVINGLLLQRARGKQLDVATAIHEPSDESAEPTKLDKPKYVRPSRAKKSAPAQEPPHELDDEL